MENFESDIAFIKAMLADIPISMEGIKCFRRNASKAGSSKPLVVTLNDANSVVAVFKNKNKLKEELIIKRDRSKQESILLLYIKYKALNEIKERISKGEKNLRIKYKNNIPCVIADLDATNESHLDASNISPSHTKNEQDHSSNLIS